MSNQYQELYKVGDIVRDKVKDRVGTVKAVEDFRGPNGHITKQIVVFNAGSTPRDYVAVEVPRLIRGNSDARSPLERLGVPPRLSLGDEVLHNGQRWRVHEVLPHGAVKVGGGDHGEAHGLERRLGRVKGGEVVVGHAAHGA